MIGLLRLLQVLAICTRYRLDLLLPKRGLVSLWPWWLVRPDGTDEERLVNALEALGPVFIKFGQLLSTRPDLLGERMVRALARLRDQTNPIPGTRARELLEERLGQSLGTIFASFDETPLASASIAQIHPARLLDGTEVVVKIVRPGLVPIIERDMSLLRLLTRIALRFSKQAYQLHPEQLVADYRHTLLDETDMRQEASNSIQMAANAAPDHLYSIPEVCVDLTREGVMVSHRMHGIPVDDIAALQAAGVDMQLLAERGQRIFFTQFLRDNFFHADMHPGNIFVDAEDPADPRYISVDCAIIGSLDSEQTEHMARISLALVNNDFTAIAQQMLRAGWVPADTPTNELTKVIRTACEPALNRPIAEVHMGEVLMNMFDAGRRVHLELQPDLALLHKTLFQIEGLGRQLYPQLDIWRTAEPMLREWFDERYGLKSIPERAVRTLDELERLPGALLKNLQQPTAGHRQHPARQTDNKYLHLLAGSALIGALWMAVNGNPMAALATAVAAGIFWIIG